MYTPLVIKLLGRCPVKLNIFVHQRIHIIQTVILIHKWTVYLRETYIMIMNLVQIYIHYSRTDSYDKSQ